MRTSFHSESHAPISGEIYRGLAAAGRLIGTNDWWIAATALAHGMNVVTNNQDELERVPGLVAITF